MNFPAFTNLSAIADSLKRNGKHKHLKWTLLRAWRAESCLADLVQAKDCCHALRKRRSDEEGPQKAHEHIEEKSLLTTALLLYARATHTSGKGVERGSISLERGRLSKSEWKDHQELIGLRNQAVAHVNPEHQTSGRTWHKVVLFAVRQSNGLWKPAASSNETSFHKETLERLERMLPIAEEIVLEKFNKRLTDVQAQINEAGVSEELLFANQFDPVEAFGSEKAVTRLLAGSKQQVDRFWYNE